MKNIFKITCLILLSISCTSDHESKLIGTWNNFLVDTGRTEFRLFTDSIVTYQYGSRDKGTWKADESNIYFYFTDKYSGSVNKIKFKYIVNDNVDSLRLSLHGESSESVIFFKINNPWERYERDMNLQMELPIADFDLIENKSRDLGVDIYVGYYNGRIAMKGKEGVLLDSLKIKYYVQDLKDAVSDVKKNKINYNLIADKRIAKNKIDSIKLILHMYPEMKIFRVYKNDGANYGSFDAENMNYNSWNWFGRME